MSQINESAIATPGVYINEIPSFPPAVAQVSTAIPVFVGYTAQAVDSNGNNAIGEAIQINSFAEYVAYFGGVPPGQNTIVTLNSAYTIESVNITPPYQMYNSVYMFYQNGGGVCYIFSVGLYGTSDPWVNLTDFIPTGGAQGCLNVIRKIDDITLLLFPDAILFTGKSNSLGFNGQSTTNVNDFYTLMSAALMLCGQLQDRFTIIDVVNGDIDRDFSNADVITTFRTGIGSMNLNYGAVYYPYVETTLPLPAGYENILIQIDGNATEPTPIYSSSGIGTISASLLALFEAGNSKTIYNQINAAVSDSINIVDAAFPNQPLQGAPNITDLTSLGNCLITLQGYINTFIGLSGFTDPATQANYFNNYMESSIPSGGPTPIENYIGQYNTIVGDYPLVGNNALPGSPSVILYSAGNDTIQGIVITNGGAGYSSATPPSVGITEDGAPVTTGFLATAVVSKGVITGINITNGGTKYPAGSMITLTGAGAGAGFAAIPTIDATGKITDITITNGGSGYTGTPTVAITQPGTGFSGSPNIDASGAVTGFTITSNGADYPAGTMVNLVGAGGTNFAATPNINSATGAITGFTITNKGNNYPTGTTVTLTQPGSLFAGSPVITDGVVTAITIGTNTVNNLSGNIAVTLTGASTTPATAIPVLAPAGITSPYGSLNSTSALTDVLVAAIPPVQQLYNNVTNLIQSFINDLTNRIKALELQYIAANPTFSNIYSAIDNGGVIVPPSGLLAGVYAATDGSRGVWKAPANVSLSGVIAPTVKIDDQMQENLNIDPMAGKSINAIRTFTGWGNLVWGARTLAGNDNDWRYIPVRRFYIMVESSVKNAAFQFVFEPNDGKTWVRIQAMISNYLTGLWRQGALAGSKPGTGILCKRGPWPNHDNG